MINISIKDYPVDDGKSAEAAGWDAAAVSFVQKGLSFMTPILMHGVCLTLPNWTFL